MNGGLLPAEFWRQAEFGGRQCTCCCKCSTHALKLDLNVELVFKHAQELLQHLRIRLAPVLSFLSTDIQKIPVLLLFPKEGCLHF